MTAFELDGQPPHERAGNDVHRAVGVATRITVWRTTCAACACPFAFSTGKRGIAQRPNRRCSACAQPQVRARGAPVWTALARSRLTFSPPLAAHLYRGVGRTGARLNHARTDAPQGHNVAATIWYIHDLMLWQIVITQERSYTTA